ncbi:MAG: LacI family DNA-binding transcriptional regulator [Candidatus Omnitrophota bacterium]
MNVYEIAKKAGVSIATISRAVNPETRSKVAPETLERLDKIIRQYHYAPNQAAKGLTQSVFNTIGMVVPHGEGFFMNEYYMKLLSGVADSLLETKYRFKLLMLKCADRKWDRYNFRAAEGVDGMIVTHWRVVFSDKSVFEKLGIPCVMIGDPERGVRASFVSADQEKGGWLAAQHLYGKGHRRFAVVTGGAFSVDSQLRMKGFQSFLRSRHIALPKDRIFCGEFQEDVAASAVEKFLKTKPKGTAIFCFNDDMAYGVIRKMREAGLRCPQDISVMGFDDDSRAAACEPPLTTVRVPLYDVAKQATRHLVEKLASGAKGFAGHEELLPVEVVVRKSVRER